MNRCFKNPLLRFAAVLLMASAWMAAHRTAWAQTFVRQFPPSAQLGVMVVTQPPGITLNGKVDRLSPGARIRGPNNLLVLSGALVGQPVLVSYVREPAGAVHQVWILTEAEASEKRQGMAPVTNYVFESDADKPKTDDGKTPFDQLPTYAK